MEVFKIRPDGWEFPHEPGAFSPSLLLPSAVGGRRGVLPSRFFEGGGSKEGKKGEEPCGGRGREREEDEREKERFAQGGEEDEEEEKVRNKGRREGGRAHFVFVASTRGATRRKGKEGTHTRKKKRKEGRRGEEGCPFLLAEEVWEEVNTATMAEGGTL